MAIKKKKTWTRGGARDGELSGQCLHGRRLFERQIEGQKLTDERPIRTHHENKECAEETKLGEK